MNNEIQIFDHEEFGQVRSVLRDGEPWFVGKDVASALGYSNASKAVITHVDEDDKQSLMVDFGADSQNGNVPTGQTKTTIINESGVYALVFGSKLPKAKEFKRWVTSEILPSVRKHGAYMTPETIEKVLTDPDTIIRLATDLKEAREERDALAEKIALDAPKVVFSDSVSASETSILVYELAKLIKQNGVDIGGKRLFEWLRENGFLCKRNGSDYNMPTQKAMEMGLFEIKETTINHADGHITVNKTPKITGKGQIYFVNKFLG